LAVGFVLLVRAVFAVLAAGWGAGPATGVGGSLRL